MSDLKRVIREGLEYWDRICELKRYGFIHSQDNSRVLKVEGMGSWIDMYEAQNIVDAAQHEINDLKAENESLRADAERYRALRRADIDTIQNGGLFVGLVPENIVINGHDLDYRCDALISSPENHS